MRPRTTECGCEGVPARLLLVLVHAVGAIRGPRGGGGEVQVTQFSTVAQA